MTGSTSRRDPLRKRGASQPGMSARSEADRSSRDSEIAGAAAPVPVLVDASGRRGRTVRTLAITGVAALAGVLVAIPASLLLPEQLHQATSASTSLNGVIFIDADCSGSYAPTAPRVGPLTVNLLRSGSVVASTTAGSDGLFAFDSVGAGSTYDVQLTGFRLAGGDAANTLFAVTPEPTTGLVGFALPPVGSTCASAAVSVPSDLGRGDDGAPRPNGQ